MLKSVGPKDDQIVRSVSDAAFYLETLSVQGEIVMLGSKESEVVSPLFWISKQVTSVCKWSKDAETRAGGKCV